MNTHKGIRNLVGIVPLLTLVAALHVLPSSATADSFGQQAAFGSFGAGTGQFQSRDAGPIAVHPADDQVFVADYNTNAGTATFRIVEFDADGSFVRVFAQQSAPPATGVFDRGFDGIAVDPTRDLLYIARSAVTANSSKVETYSTVSGAKQGDFEDNTAPLEELSGIDVDPVDGSVFLLGGQGADLDPKLRKYTPAGTPAGGTFGARGLDEGTEEGKFSASIDDFAVRNAGAGTTKVYALDRWFPAEDDENGLERDRVQRFTVSGNSWSYDAGSQFFSTDELESDDPDYDKRPFFNQAIEAAPNGDLLLSHAEAGVGHGVVRLSEAGNSKALQWGSQGTGACQFGRAPRSIALGVSGTVFAFDPGLQADLGTGRRVLKFGPGGGDCGITGNSPPLAEFGFTPAAPAVGQQVTFDASASADSDGSITKYEWDLDGNGSFETDTGSNSQATQTYTAPGDVTVSLRVTDDGSPAATDTASEVVTIGGGGPAGATVTKNGNRLQYTAGAGQSNSLRVVNTGGNSGTVTFTDSGPIEPVAPCTQGTSAQQVVCPSRSVKGIDVQTGDMDDLVELSSKTKDTIDTGAGDDRYDAGNEKNGADTFNGGDGIDTADYSRRVKKLKIDTSVPRRDGEGESDDIRPDVEALIGGPANDTLTGGPHSNRIVGGGGNDVLDGGAGDDDLDGGLGADLIKGGSGVDTASYASKTVPVVVDLDGQKKDDGAAGEQDTLETDIEGVIGGSGADKLTGNASANLLAGNGGADELTGAGGDDTLRGGAGSDNHVGGAGLDIADYSDRAVDVKVDLDGKQGDDGAKDEKDTLATDVEGVVGGSGDDRLVGNNANNGPLSGGAGDDQLTGQNGNDVLVGGPGKDNLNGGAGNDSLDAKDGVKDRISCGGGTDTLLRDALDPSQRACESSST